jgi:hypothetical protein
VPRKAFWCLHQAYQRRMWIGKTEHSPAWFARRLYLREALVGGTTDLRYGVDTAQGKRQLGSRTSTQLAHKLERTLGCANANVVGGSDKSASNITMLMQWTGRF